MAASTPRQILLRKAGEAMSPDKSVERLNVLAELLLAQVALVGTVLAGLGLFTDIGKEFADEPLLVLIPLGLVIATLAASLLALAPQPKDFNPANLTQIDNIYRDSIQWKQLWVSIGFACLTAAVISAGAPAFIDALDDDEITAQLSVGLNTAAGNTGAIEVVQTTAKLEGVPRGAAVQIKVTDGSADTGRLLASRRVIVGSSGEVDITFDSVTGEDLGAPTLSVVVSDAKKELFSDQISPE